MDPNQVKCIDITVDHGAEGIIKQQMKNWEGIVNNDLNLHGQHVGHYLTMDLKVCGVCITYLGNDFVVINGEEEASSGIFLVGLLEDQLGVCFV
jgi:hypothetical protein